ncbi:VOC family protein [Changchengzhania lutea]|uniref:VOC family protein n=1 Tax=Changchengzhania lutea TaxID=2049305 RepID=UPI00115DDE1A|nr:VOC family protein [Changchengzhania lutea]
MKFKFSPHIAVQVKDLNRARDFYTDVLGMEFLSENEQEIKLRASGITFYLEENNNRQVFFAFEVDSMPVAKKILIENNCLVTMESSEGIMISDPNGLSYFVSETIIEP